MTTAGDLKPGDTIRPPGSRCYLTASPIEIVSIEATTVAAPFGEEADTVPAVALLGRYDGGELWAATVPADHLVTVTP